MEPTSDLFAAKPVIGCRPEGGNMPFPWQIATSSAAGALITLIGVFVGATLTGRTQRRLWNRGKQIDTCTDILAESTRIQQALVGKWKHDTAIEWVPWNQALAAI